MPDITINLTTLRETIEFGMHPTHDELRFLWQLATGSPLPRKQRCPLCNAEGRIKQQVNATLSITNDLVKEKVTTHKLEETSKPCPHCNGTGYEQLPEDNFLIEFTPHTPAHQLVPLDALLALTPFESEVWFRSHLPPHSQPPDSPPKCKTWGEYVVKAEQTWNSLRPVKENDEMSNKRRVRKSHTHTPSPYSFAEFVENYYRFFPEERPTDVPTTNPPSTSPDPSPQPASQRQEPQQPSPPEVPAQPPPPETSRQVWQWPEWLTAEWIAMDESGAWFAYDSEPSMLSCSWSNGHWQTWLGNQKLNQHYPTTFRPPPCTDWRQSKRRNPRKVKP